MQWKKKIGAVGVGAVLVGSVALATQQSAQALDPTWSVYDNTNGALAAVNDPITGSGILEIGGAVLNLGTFDITCDIPVNLFTHDLTAGDLTAAPGSDLEIALTPDAVLSSSDSGDPTYAVCMDGTVPVDVTTTEEDVTIVVEMPPAPPNPDVSGDDYVPVTINGNPHVKYTGELTGELRIPQNALTVTDDSIGCKGQGPTASPYEDFTGKYDTVTGKVTDSPAGPPYQTFGVTGLPYTNNCTFLAAYLAKADLTLSPILTVAF